MTPPWGQRSVVLVEDSHSGDLCGSAGEKRALPWSRALLGISGGAGLGSLHSIANSCVLLGPGADKEGCFKSVIVGVS